jgi:apolipoprotein N-acyltransferase
MAGENPKIFTLPEGNFGVTICWENIFSGLVRRFVQGGAQFMVNLTNEARFGKSTVSRQFLSFSVFRAIENGVSVVRSGNSGISSIIDPFGRIRARLKDENGDEVMVKGVLTASVPPPAGQTFFTRYGDIFAITIASIAVLLFLSALFPLRIRETLRIAEIAGDIKWIK